MTGIERIAAERKRQIEQEGWTPEHDDAYHGGELRVAGACYTLIGRQGAFTPAFNHWPWSLKWWKPSDDPIRNLEKAGALIAAEIDRLERAALKGETNG